MHEGTVYGFLYIHIDNRITLIMRLLVWCHRYYIPYATWGTILSR